MGETASLTEVKRELALAARAVGQAGAGAPANLECRLADLQQRFLTTRAASLADIAARLEVIRDLVQGLGERGYLFDLVEATLADVRALSTELPRD